LYKPISNCRRTLSIDDKLKEDLCSLFVIERQVLANADKDVSTVAVY
jgi:hypothetical protein